MLIAIVVYLYVVSQSECHVPETIPHFLLICPRFQHHRLTLRRSVPRSQFSLMGLLGQRSKHVHKTIKFVEATGRLVIFQSSPPPNESSSTWTQGRRDSCATGMRGGGDIVSLPSPAGYGGGKLKFFLKCATMLINFSRC